MPMKRFVPAVLLCAILAGCATQPTDIPDNGLISQQAIAEQYRVDREWWKGYGDARLNAMVDHALANNIDLRKSAISVNRALYQANLLGENLVPEFSAGADASVKKNLQKGVTTHNYGADIGINYELDLWGRLRDAASAQEWEYKATKLDLESSRLALINNVIDGYFNLVYIKQAIKITRQNIDFYTKLEDISKRKFKVGTVDVSDPLNAEKALLGEKDALASYEVQRKTAEQMLRNLLNLRPEDPLDTVTDDLLAIPLIGVDLNVPVAALGLRPDVKAAEFRIQSAFMDWNAAKKDLYPSISIGGSLGVSSNRAHTMFNSPNLNGMVQLNLPFLQWNKLRWNIKLSEAAFEDAKLGLTSAVNTALNEVDTYYYSYEKARAQIGIARQKYQNDARISAYSHKRYQVGTYEMKDWLQARCSENQSMMSLLAKKYETIKDENAVYKALGARIYND